MMKMMLPLMMLPLLKIKLKRLIAIKYLSVLGGGNQLPIELVNFLEHAWLK
jgi:hypothetical protein